MLTLIKNEGHISRSNKNYWVETSHLGVQDSLGLQDCVDRTYDSILENDISVNNYATQEGVVQLHSTHVQEKILNVLNIKFYCVTQVQDKPEVFLKTFIGKGFKAINSINNTGISSENMNRVIKFTEQDKQSLDMRVDKMGALQIPDSSLVSYFNMTNTKTVGGISHDLEKSQCISKHGQYMTCYEVLDENRSCDSNDVALDISCLLDTDI